MKYYSIINLLIKGTLTLALFSLYTLGNAQCVQRVQVLEYMGASPKQPLGGVIVGVSNAPQAQSDESGNIQLNFRTQKEGDPVQVRRIEKAGYELFNSSAIQQWIVSDNEPFRIVMCRTDSLRAMREEYMKHASASYRQQYERESQAIEREHRQRQTSEEDFNRQMMSLQQFYNLQAAQLARYVDQFVRIDLSELTQKEAEIIRLASSGRLGEAISAFERADYVGQLAQQIADIQKIDSAQSKLRDELARLYRERLDLLHVIYRQFIVYKLAGGRENYAKAYHLLKNVADTDSTSFEANWLYVILAKEQNMVDDVVKYATRCLSLTGQEHLLRRINCYRIMNATYGNIGDVEKELYYENKAIDICEEAFRTGHGTPFVRELYASMMLNRSEQAQKNGEYDEALRYMEMAEGPFVEAYREFETDKSRYYMACVLDIKSLILNGINPKDPQVLALSDSLIQLLHPHCMESTYMMECYASALNNRIHFFEKGSPEQEECAIMSSDFMKRIYEMNPNGNDLNYTLSLIVLAGTYLSRDKADAASPLIEDIEKMTASIETRYRRPFPHFHAKIIELKIRYALAKGTPAESLHELAQQGLQYFNQMLPHEQKQNEETLTLFKSL